MVHTLVHAFWSNPAADVQAQVVLVHTMLLNFTYGQLNTQIAVHRALLCTYTGGLCQSVIMGWPTRDQRYQSLTTRAHVKTGETRSRIALPHICYDLSGSSVVA